jgi:hypothetical protein
VKTNVDGLAQAIQKTLADYEGVTIESMKSAVDKASKEAVRELKSSSPKRNGAYARSWTSEKKKLVNKYAYEKTVYNKDHYRLTHLLEKGHRVVGAKNGRTWVDARPHIEKVEQKAVETLVNEMKETL